MARRVENILYVALLLIGTAALVVFASSAVSHFDLSGFYALLTFLGTILLVY